MSHAHSATLSKWQRKWTICPKKKVKGALGSQTEVAQWFNGAEERCACWSGVSCSKISVVSTIVQKREMNIINELIGREFPAKLLNQFPPKDTRRLICENLLHNVYSQSDLGCKFVHLAEATKVSRLLDVLQNVQIA